MRSMRKLCGIAGVVAALGALGGAASASAATIGPAGTAFTGVNGSGEHVLGFSGSIRLRCNAVKYTGTTASPATGSVSFDAAYGSATGIAGSWCRLYTSPTGVPTTVTVATTASWTLTANAFDVLTGASTGAVTTGGTTTLKTATGSCVITLPSGTVLGATGQNSPGGLTETLSQTSIGFTATPICAAWGIPTSGSYASYTGSVGLAGLAVS